jgi:hypothetical protein
LRRTTENLRSEDQTRIAGLTETLARQVEQVSNYLRNKDAAAMRTDLENVARRQPALMIGGALVLGLIGARFLKSSERRRERGWSGERQYGQDVRYSRGGGYGTQGYGTEGYGREEYGSETGFGYGRAGIAEGETGRRSGIGGSGIEDVGGGYAGA